MDRRTTITVAIGAWFLGLYSLAFLLPIYIDEVGYDYLLGRYFRENGFSLSMWPQCLSAFKQSVPALWMMPRMIMALAYDGMPSLTAVRLVSSLGALLAPFLVLKILRASASPRLSREALLLVAGLSVGTLPFMSVVARPDGILLLLTLWSILLSQRGVGRKGRVAGLSPSGLVILLCAYFAASIHPLGVVLFPVFVATFAQSHRLTVLNVGLLLIVGAAVGVSAEYHSHAAQCPEIPFLSQFLGHYTGITDGMGLPNLGPKLLHTFRWYLSLVRSLDIDSNYPFGFLENDVPRQSSEFLVVLSRVLTSSWLVLLLTLLVRALPGRSLDLKAAMTRGDPIVTVVGLGVSFLLFVVAQPEPASYRLTILVPLVITGVGMLILRRPESSPSWSRIRELLSLFAVSALSSSALTVVARGATVVEMLQHDVTTTSVLYQSHPLASPSGNLTQLLDTCGISDASEFRRILVDNVSYWQLRQTTEPMFVEFVANDLLPLEAGKMAHRVTELGASGYVTHCDNVRRFDLPPPSHREGVFCCGEVSRGK
jgi:hypothetical protein